MDYEKDYKELAQQCKDRELDFSQVIDLLLLRDNLPDTVLEFFYLLYKAEYKPETMTAVEIVKLLIYKIDFDYCTEYQIKEFLYNFIERSGN